MADWANSVAVGVALLSLFVSVYVAWRSRKDSEKYHQEILGVQKRQAELQEVTTRLHVAEAASKEAVLTSARLTVTLEGWGLPNPHIVITNIGGAPAENVNLEFPDFDDGFPLVSGDFEGILPLKRLDPMQRCKLMADDSLGNPSPPWEGFIAWSDPGGGNRRERIYVYAG